MENFQWQISDGDYCYQITLFYIKTSEPIETKTAVPIEQQKEF